MPKNKKTILFSVILSSLCLAMVVLPASAGILPPCAASGNCQLVDFIQLFINISDAIVKFLGAIALLFFIYGGFTWLTAAGSPEKVKKGSSILVGAVIGIVIVFGAYRAVSFIGVALGVPGQIPATIPGEVTGGTAATGTAGTPSGTTGTVPTGTKKRGEPCDFSYDCEGSDLICAPIARVFEVNNPTCASLNIILEKKVCIKDQKEIIEFPCIPIENSAYSECQYGLYCDPKKCECIKEKLAEWEECQDDEDCQSDRCASVSSTINFSDPTCSALEIAGKSKVCVKQSNWIAIGASCVTTAFTAYDECIDSLCNPQTCKCEK